MAKKILIVLDTTENRMSPSGFELISFAREAASALQGDPVLLLAGCDIHDAALSVSKEYGIDIMALEDERLFYPHPQLLARAVRQVQNDIEASLVCLPHTMRGCQAAADISYGTNSSCVTGIESFSISGGGQLIFTRSILNGKLLAVIEPEPKNIVVTVLPGAYAVPDRVSGSHSPGTVAVKSIQDIPSSVSITGITETDAGSAGLEEADVIISAGRGIGSEENLGIIREVAGIFPNAAVGASRIVCDNKWLPYAHQIGTTGKTVSPKLYMACGISGAQQHIAGMKGSRIVVAVNTDPNAAIYSYAHYIIIEDLTTFLPLLVEKKRQTDSH